jgi:hypothetical protein
MKKLSDFIEKIPGNNILFYGSVIFILLTIVAVRILIHWSDNNILNNLAYFIFFIIGMVLTYIGEFLHVKPLWVGIFLSAIISLITGIVLIVYLKYIKGDDEGITLPIAFFTQLIL